MKLHTLFMALFGAAVLIPAVNAQAVLTRAELQTVTDGDNKDHDTCVWVSVSTADGSSTLAHADGSDCGGNNSTEYTDGSTHTIKLVVDAGGATKDACKGFTVRLWQKTHGGRGHDRWKVDKAFVTLFFSDGLNLKAEKSNFELNSNSEDDSPEVTFSNTAK